jgi:hypothetical protein
MYDIRATRTAHEKTIKNILSRQINSGSSLEELISLNKFLICLNSIKCDILHKLIFENNIMASSHCLLYLTWIFPELEALIGQAFIGAAVPGYRKPLISKPMGASGSPEG